MGRQPARATSQPPKGRHSWSDWARCPVSRHSEPWWWGSFACYAGSRQLAGRQTERHQYNNKNIWLFDSCFVFFPSRTNVIRWKEQWNVAFAAGLKLTIPGEFINALVELFKINDSDLKTSSMSSIVKRYTLLWIKVLFSSLFLSYLTCELVCVYSKNWFNGNTLILKLWFLKFLEFL